MASGSIGFRGTADLIGKLKRSANLNDVKRIVQMNGAEMQGSMSRKAPVDTSNLKRNIKITILDDGFTARVSSEAEYAPYQEYGTRYQSGTPHVRPAYHEQKPLFLQDMKRIMK